VLNKSFTLGADKDLHHCSSQMESICIAQSKSKWGYADHLCYLAGTTKQLYHMDLIQMLRPDRAISFFCSETLEVS